MQVKRFTMGMGLLRNTEDSRPLMHNKSASLHSGSSQTISDGYVNEAICETEKFVNNQFGDACGKSLTSLPLFKDAQQLAEQNEFGNYRNKILRETCSGM